ncbi:MAG: helix-turn-helix domain-containing protein [Bacteroidota bacterium]
MSLENQILFFFSALGVFNGFLASFYLLFFKKKNRLPNYFLGLLILMLSIRIGKSVYMTFNAERVFLYLQIGLSACFMIGVMLYYYLKASLAKVKTVPRSWWLHITGLVFFILLVGIIRPYENYPEFWRPYFTRFIYLVWGIYVVASGFLLKDILRTFFSRKTKSTTAQLWLLLVFASNAVIYIAYNVGIYRWYIGGALSFSFALYVIIFFLIFKKNRDAIFKEEREKYGAKKIDEKEAGEMLKKLSDVMLEEELYKNPNVKLKQVADAVGISPHRLSQLLNDNFGKSFALFINEHRIEEAKRLLRENDQYTLEAIGFEAGFSSKSTFYATFKKLIGKTPAEFRR